MADERAAIGILGGTAGVGFGLALRFCAAGLRVVIGSRVGERAVAAAARVQHAVPAARVVGRPNDEAAVAADVVALCVPAAGMEAMVAAHAPALEGKILLDVVVPVRVHADFAELRPPGGAASAGEWLQAALPRTRVVSAFKNVAAATLRDLGQPAVGDVLVCGEDAAARAHVAALVARLPALRAVDAGSIRNAHYVEGITALLLTLNRRHGIHGSIRITGLGEAASS